MKPLYQLTTIEKAILFHELFPDEIAALLDFTEGMADTIKEEQDRLNQIWSHPVLGNKEWLSLAASIGTRIKQYRARLQKECLLFSEQLFSGDNRLFMFYCLEQYTTTLKHPNPKFTQAVALLFF